MSNRREFFRGFAGWLTFLFAWPAVALADAVESRRPTRGTASWYGEEYRGRPMANGQPFDPEALTCASFDFPLGAWLRVRCLTTGRTVCVQVTDRGPARRLMRLVDLSRAAFAEVAALRTGVVPVEVEMLTLAEAFHAWQLAAGGAA